MDLMLYVLQAFIYPSLAFMLKYILRRLDKQREQIEEVRRDVAEIKAVLRAYKFPVDPERS